MAAPGGSVDCSLRRAIATEPSRTQRPSMRPMTAWEPVARTGDPLCPSTTGWLYSRTSAGSANFSSLVSSMESTVPADRSSTGNGKLSASRKRAGWSDNARSEEHTSELQSRENLVCRLLLEKKKRSSLENDRVLVGFVGSISANRIARTWLP